MDLKTWQTRVRERLTAAGDVLRESGPGMIYGALATFSILPLVSAVNQGDFAAVGALYKVDGHPSAPGRLPFNHSPRSPTSPSNRGVSPGLHRLSRPSPLEAT